MFVSIAVVLTLLSSIPWETLLVGHALPHRWSVNEVAKSSPLLFRSVSCPSPFLLLGHIQVVSGQDHILVQEDREGVCDRPTA